MERRILGKTGLEVSRLGLGLAQIGAFPLDDADRVGALIHAALDNGINFLDTAASYRNSEELIGRAVSHRRGEYVLATKCGHWAAEAPWTAGTVREHIDRSLQRLRTDCVDLVQIHSCGVDVLERGEVIGALLEARDAGKTRFVGYSGDNEAAGWAVDSGLFDTLQTSFNVVDQRARTRLFPYARKANVGVIVKRTIANATWGGSTATAGTTVQFSKMYERVEKMMSLGPIPGAPDHRILTALGFTLARSEIDVALVGTTNPEHLVDNIRLVENEMPIAEEVVAEFCRRFDEVGGDWAQLI